MHAEGMHGTWAAAHAGLRTGPHGMASARPKSSDLQLGSSFKCARWHLQQSQRQLECTVGRRGRYERLDRGQRRQVQPSLHGRSVHQHGCGVEGRCSSCAPSAAVGRRRACSRASQLAGCRPAGQGSTKKVGSIALNSGPHAGFIPHTPAGCWQPTSPTPLRKQDLWQAGGRSHRAAAHLDCARRLTIPAKYLPCAGRRGKQAWGSTTRAAPAAASSDEDTSELMSDHTRKAAV